jgi:dihydrofolate reductase
VPSLEAALARASGDAEPFVVGGGEIFALALPRADRLYVTWVEAELLGDAYFPPLDLSKWKLIREESVSADEKNEYPTTYAVYERAVG